MSNLIELRPNRDLLDANFNGYKLSLEAVPIFRSTLKSGVDHILPSDEQYSFLHVKAFGLHNHLYGDPWSIDDVYYIDDRWRLQKNVFAANSRRIDDWVEVWELPSHHERKPGHYNTSMKFTSPDLAIVADGAGTLHLLDTGRRRDSAAWNVLFSEEVCGKENAFIIVDSQLTTVDKKRVIHCLLQHIDETRVESSSGKAPAEHFKTILEWITLSEEESRSWSMMSVRKLSGGGGVDYAAFERGCRCVYIASSKKFNFIIDSEKAVEMQCPLEPNEEKKFFSWMQTGDNITVWVPLPERERGDDGAISKEDCKVIVEEGSLRVTCQGEVLLEGATWQQLDSTQVRWHTDFVSQDYGRVELFLTKVERGVHWPELVKGNVDGEEIVEDPTLNVDRLAHLTSEKEVTEVSDVGCSPGFNSEQLEDCDSLPDISQLMRLDSHSHAITHQVNLGGHQWLFNAQLNPDEALALCLRFDVDGCMWQVAPPVGDNGDWPCTHVGTFFAFGYVQASKTQKKFTICSPDMSYVAICEANRHIYLYRQPSPVEGDLRNRKSGKNVGQIAKQQLITLDSTTEVLGIHSSNSAIYVLTSDTLYALQINV